MNDLNLQRIRYEIGQELGHVPDTRAWTDRVDRMIAQVHAELWDAEPWPFRVRESALHVYPDFTLTQLEAELVTGADVDRVFEVTDVGNIAGRMFPLVDALETPEAEGHIQRLVGAEWGLETLATADRVGGNWTSGPFVIQKANLNGDAVRVWLDPRCHCVAHGTTGSWSVRFPRYRLPADFDAWAHGAVQREGRPLDVLSSRQLRLLERGVNRPPLTAAGPPTAWAWDAGLDQSPDDLIATRLNQSQGWTPDQTPMAVIEQLEGGVNPGPGGDFLADQLYRFAVSWYYEGRFGPLSNVVELTPGVGDTVNLVLPTLQGNAALTPQTNLGWAVGVWIAKGDGPFELSEIKDPPPNAPDVTNLIVVTGRPDPKNQYRRVRYEQVATPPRYIRLWPRPAAHEQLSIRYFRRPIPMEAPTDVPDGVLPQFRRYLVVETAVRLATGDGQPGSSPALSTVGRLKAQSTQLYRRMLGHYFPERARGHQRQALLAPTGPDALLAHADDLDWHGDT